MDVTEFHGPNTPALQQQWEQGHAKAVEALRSAGTFLLVTVKETDDGKVEGFVAATTCEGAHMAIELYETLRKKLPAIEASLSYAIADTVRRALEEGGDEEPEAA